MIVHSIIDGFFHGIFREKSNFGLLILSLVIHKLPLAITFGTAFKMAGRSPKDLLVSLIFVTYILSAPIGLFAGINLKISDSSIPMIVL
jgi:di/tricarboxylate transporter